MNHGPQEKRLTAFTAEGVERGEVVAVEEPLQITLDGHPLAVVMRTPGHDDELVRGFLVTERIVAAPDMIRKIDLESRPNHALVFLRDPDSFDPARLRRNLYSASSCGICGKASIDDVLTGFPPIENAPLFPPAAVLAAPDRLRAEQATFDTTGGLHAAALFDREGHLLLAREDVGRHNAVDKVIGAATRDGIDATQAFLLVSGRLSFEIMQKALGARLPMVAAISAPSSLAVEFAGRSGQTLVAFLRPPRFNVYAGKLA